MVFDVVLIETYKKTLVWGVVPMETLQKQWFPLVARQMQNDVH